MFLQAKDRLLGPLWTPTTGLVASLVWRVATIPEEGVSGWWKQIWNRYHTLTLLKIRSLEDMTISSERTAEVKTKKEKEKEKKKKG
jgi:hypothetical protein